MIGELKCVKNVSKLTASKEYLTNDQLKFAKPLLLYFTFGRSLTGLGLFNLQKSG